jgi:hypothetical protein
MESRVMEKLTVSVWGASINAEGLVAIGATVAIVAVLAWMRK